jgi:hypothetical protein
MKRTVAQVSGALLVFTLISASSAAALGSPCLIKGPGSSFCAGFVSFSSYYLSVPFRPFQAVSGSGSQPDIVVSFSPYVAKVRVWANDPDFSGSRSRLHLATCCYFDTPYQGDGVPGLFSVESGGFLVNGPFDHVRLESANTDYLNWRVEYAKGKFDTSWCKVTSQTTQCGGVTATVSQFYQGSGFDTFQGSNNGTGVQAPIEVTFGFPLYKVWVTAVDPDYGGTRMEAYADDGTLLGTVFFDGDNSPGFTTTSTKSFASSTGIRSVKLIAASNDYVVWQGLSAQSF